MLNALPIDRYSSTGIDRITRQVRNKALVYSGLAVLAGFAIATISMGAHQIASMLPVFAVGAAILLWIQHRSASRIKALVESTEIELTATELTARSSAISTTIRLEDIVELRTMPDGIFLRTRDPCNASLLRPELEGFEDLAARLDQCMPAAVPRNRENHGGSMSGAVQRWPRWR